MNYLYHMIPLNMQRNVLYPLNDLREIYPKIYKEHKKKYTGREHLLKVEIPRLNCLWNDVLHLTAVNPINVMNALIESGSKSNFKELHWYKINPRDLVKENAIIFLYKDRVNERERRHDLDNFTEFNIPY